MAIEEEIGAKNVSEEVGPFLDRLGELDGIEGIVVALRSAGALMEFSAYEIARLNNVRHVSQLILTSAEMERIALELETSWAGNGDRA